MSAVNPQASSSPAADATADKAAYEPSMEEILASIRRIIADDQSFPGKAAREAGSSASPIKRDLPRQAPVAEAPVGGASVSAAPVSEAPLSEYPVAEPSIVDRSTGTAPALAGQANRQDHGPPEPLSPEPRHRAATPVVPDAPLDSGMAHGSIAAPQFPMPDRPAAADQLPQRATARAAVEAPPLPPKTASPASTSAYAEGASARDQLGPERQIESGSPDDSSRGTQVKAPIEAAGLFSASTDSAVSAAFNMLAASRLADNSDELMTLARDMIRPMLRIWIDDNMPSMVERMVRAEIERVARGGR